MTMTILSKKREAYDNLFHKVSAYFSFFDCIAAMCSFLSSSTCSVHIPYTSFGIVIREEPGRIIDRERGKRAVVFDEN